MGRKVYVGLDLGGKFHEVQVTDESGVHLGRSFRIRRGREGYRGLQQGLAKVVGSDDEPVFTIEATRNYWQEMVHPLQRAGRTVYLVSPDKSAGLREFFRRHTKTDAIDAEATSRLPVVDLRLRARPLTDRRIEAVMRLVRQYWRLRGQMASRKKRLLDRVTMVYPGYELVFQNRYCLTSIRFIGAYLDPRKPRRLGRQRLYRIMRADSMGHFSPAAMERLWKVIENAPDLDIDYTDLQFSVSQELELLAGEERVRRLLRDRVIALYAELDPESRLTTIPGLGDFMAAALTAFIGDVSRFQSSNEVVALAGLCPKHRSSAGHTKAHLPMTKHGDPVIRSCLYHAVQVTRQYDPEIQLFYARLRTKGKHHNVASCAAAAKLLRRCVAVLREQRTYRITGISEIARLNEKEGRTIRESVAEVVKRLKDSQGRILPATETTAAESGCEAASGQRSSPTPEDVPREKRGAGRRAPMGKMVAAAHASDATRPAEGI